MENSISNQGGGRLQDTGNLIEIVRNTFNKEGRNTGDVDYCDVCKEVNRVWVWSDYFGVALPEHRECKCEREKADLEKKAQANKLFTNAFRLSCTPGKMDTFTFENWVGNADLLSFGMSYCRDFGGIGGFQQKGVGAVLGGNCGTGKTYVSNCIVAKLCSMAKRPVFVGHKELLDRIRSTFDEKGESQNAITRALVDSDIVILDDLGAYKMSEWAENTTAELIDSLYRNETPIIATTNLSLDSLKKYLDGKSNAHRTSGRLIERCPYLWIEGDDMRAEKTKQTREMMKKSLFG